MSIIASLVEEYVSVRNRRRLLETEANDIRTGREAELEQMILQEMCASGIKSANLEGIGRVTDRVTSYYEIEDIEALAQQMFKQMLESAKAGRPFSDGLLLQRRVHKENLETAMDQSVPPSSDQTPEQLANYISQSFGVKQVSKHGISITKA